MKLQIGQYEFSEVWDNIYYKKLSDYPNVSDWEMKNIIQFMEYEAQYGRTTYVEADDPKIKNTIFEKLKAKEKYFHVSRPNKITECTACPYRKGCITEFVCHTAPLENAKNIFRSGKLLAAIHARKLPAEVLMKEERNRAHDPADFFHYVMFAWGNCQAGDRLVMERKMNRLPTEEDLSVHFTPGVRFYFKYDEIAQHPQATFDGFLPIKVLDEVDLAKWVYAIIIPKNYQEELVELIPNQLTEKVHYIENDCKDIWDWSEKVYTYVEKLSQK